MVKNPDLMSLLMLVGDQNTITIHRAVVYFCGKDRNAASMLEQLLYWTPRSRISIKGSGGWIAKTDSDFSDELHMTVYGVRKSKKYLEDRGLIEVFKKKFNGSPTLHYRIIQENLAEQWREFAVEYCENEETVFSNTKDGNDEDEQSITETTTEITENISTDTPDFRSMNMNEIRATYPTIALYEKITGAWPGSKRLPTIWRKFVNNKVLVTRTFDEFSEAWDEWLDRGYNVNGMGWLDWVIQGYIPDRFEQKSAAPQQTISAEELEAPSWMGE